MKGAYAYPHSGNVTYHSYNMQSFVYVRFISDNVDIRYCRAPSDTPFLNNQVVRICKDTAVALFWHYPGNGLEEPKENNTENLGMDLNPLCPYQVGVLHSGHDSLQYLHNVQVSPHQAEII